MNTSNLFKLIALTLILTVSSAAARLVDDLLATYQKVETVSCEVRRISEIDGEKVRSLSRVQYQHPDMINVYSRAPIKRRHVADGERLYYHVEGDPKGFARPIAELDQDWLISLRQVPGTPMNHLLEIGDAEEHELPATDDSPLRRGYQTEKPFIVLSLDADGRLMRIEYFEDSGMEHRLLLCEYKNFVEALSGVWIPLLHTRDLNMHGLSKQETAQFINLIVNEPIAKNMFNPKLYFKDVEFVDDFEKIYH